MMDRGSIKAFATVLAIGSGIALLPTSVMWLFAPLAFGPGGKGGWSAWMGFAAVAGIPTLLLVSLILAIRCWRVPSGRLLAIAAGLALTAFAIPMIGTALRQVSPHEPAQMCFNDRYLDSAGRYDPNRLPKPGHGKMVCRNMSDSSI